MVRTKKVSIRCTTPVFGIIPNRPLFGYIAKMDLTVDQIRICITRKANVKEILPNGQFRQLDLTNYDKFDEPAVVEAPVQVPVEPTFVEKTEIEEKTVTVDPVVTTFIGSSEEEYTSVRESHVEVTKVVETTVEETVEETGEPVEIETPAVDEVVAEIMEESLEAVEVTTETGLETIEDLEKALSELDVEEKEEFLTTEEVTEIVEGEKFEKSEEVEKAQKIYNNNNHYYHKKKHK